MPLTPRIELFSDCGIVETFIAMFSLSFANFTDCEGDFQIYHSSHPGFMTASANTAEISLSVNKTNYWQIVAHSL